METNKNTAAAFSEGEQVELVDLQKSPHLNHRIGHVAGDKSMETGRYPVALDGKKMAIKPENLKIFDDSVEICNGCLKRFSSSALMTCQSCLMVEYCGRKCQETHWHQKHKDNCKIFKEARKARHDESKLPTDPAKRVELRLLRALRWDKLGKCVNAEAEYKALLQENPENGFVPIYTSLVDVILRQNPGPEKVDESIALLRKAAKLPFLREMEREKNSRAKAYRHLGDLLYDEKGDLDGAEEAFKEVINLGCSDDPATILRAERMLEDIQQNKMPFLSQSA